MRATNRKCLPIRPYVRQRQRDFGQQNILPPLRIINNLPEFAPKTAGGCTSEDEPADVCLTAKAVRGKTNACLKRRVLLELPIVWTDHRITFSEALEVA